MSALASSTSAATSTLAPSNEGVLSNDWAVFFWHSPGWPAQWTPIPIHHTNCTYSCAEQAMMHQKALLFHDSYTAQLILAASTPAQHKRLGRAVKGFDETVWNEHKFRIVCEINRAKFSQHSLYGDQLLATGDKVLVEATPLDKVWGVGMDAKGCMKFNSLEEAEAVWTGQNLLGKALMVVRDVLRVEREKETRLS